VFLLQAPQPTPQPFIVEISRPPADELTIADLLVNSLGLAAAFAVAAIPLGLIVGYLMIKWHARRPPEADHMPHVSPSLELNDPPGPPSGPVP
jgi:ABC-type Fe3+ transport system permease subunit